MNWVDIATKGTHVCSMGGYSQSYLLCSIAQEFCTTKDNFFFAFPINYLEFVEGYGTLQGHSYLSRITWGNIKSFHKTTVWKKFLWIKNSFSSLLSISTERCLQHFALLSVSFEMVPNFVVVSTFQVNLSIIFSLLNIFRVSRLLRDFCKCIVAETPIHGRPLTLIEVERW